MSTLTDKIRNITLTPTFQCLPQKGNLKYEYNPIRNLRSTKSTPVAGGQDLPPGTLLDMDTKLLNFDLRHPVKMEAQPSYDGSVNLILNDGVNQPRLINTRFSVTGKDTYQIVDREGDNDTNIYDEESFDTDISLYKRINQIIKIKFNGVSQGGRMKVGNYVFYFKLCDSDGNETDFAGESGIVTCYIGGINDPHSIQGGNRDENSNKSVNFVISQIDSSYNYVKVYYTRSTSDIWTPEMTTAFKIIKDYPIYNNVCSVSINGYEEQIEVSLNDINVQYQLVNAAQTQASAQNRLFLGNLKKQEIDYKTLTQLALRFYPTVDMTADIGYVEQTYKDSSNKYEYYNPMNVYHYLGYWDREIYRFGVVFILDDFSLSPVFNICGRTILNEDDLSNSDKQDLLNANINKDTYAINDNINCKGVSRIDIQNNNREASQISGNKVHPIGIKMQFYIPSGRDETLEGNLKALGIRGYFFVRQKRIPTILCQMLTIGLEVNAHLPALPVDSNEPTTDNSDTTSVGNDSKYRYMMESFIDDKRLLDSSFNKRRRIYTEGYMMLGGAAICPEFEMNQPFFNQFFTASDFRIRTANFSFSQHFCKANNRHFYMLPDTKQSQDQFYQVQIVAVEDNVKYMKNKNTLYAARAGEAEEAARTSQAKFKNNGPDNIHVFRGSYGPYLGIEPAEDILPDIYNVYTPGYDESLMKEYFQIRYQDSSAFYAISDRIRTEDAETITCYRGDCFIGNFTHRMVRNFQDPTSPTNDDILDLATWKDNYNLNDAERLSKLNRGDVNAVPMGHWVTTKVCSNINISLRSVDHSFASEELTNGRPRNFYPLYSMDSSGNGKLPESFAYNHGYSSTTSDKYNWETPMVPAIKDVFKTRVLYSEVAINDAFKNGYREFLMTHYRDYPMTYGELINLVELKGNLLAVFEHGVGIIPINERVVSGAGAGGNVFINTANVLPETLNILSDMYGSQWPESVVKTPYYVYGIDTVGKKIWRTNGANFDIISDFRVQKFLIDNITLAESEKEPIIGIRNVKSHYNAYKSDVMFTFYDNLDAQNEKVWNLCWNEISQTFVTFFSWVPSYSANIDNMFFSFDRDTSKIIAITTGNYYPMYLKTIENPPSVPNFTFLGALEFKEYSNTIRKDITLVNAYDSGRFYIRENSDGQGHYEYYLYVKDGCFEENDYITCAIKADMQEGTTVTEQGITQASNARTIYGVVGYYKGQVPSTAFWKHGQAGLIEADRILPCKWYGKQHPFEFEFVVRDDPNTHKIFNNLEIISNKAKPDSFHFEIVGEVYDWAKDKPNMFFRQEATKNLMQNLGSNITYDPRYKDIHTEQRRMIGSFYYDKSTYFPLYYERRGHIDTVYDHYVMMGSKSVVPRDYAHLSGSEIVYDQDLNEFKVQTHIRNIPINSYDDKEITREQYEYIVTHFTPNQRRVFAWQEPGQEVKYYERIFYGRLKGNSQYLEDKWNVQIPSITLMQKNESQWPNNRPPIILEPDRLPSDLTSYEVNQDTIPEGLSIDDVQVLPNTYDRGNGYPAGGWTSRKETKIRDKYCKVRVRYTGEDLAVISAIKTFYTISYA